MNKEELFEIIKKKGLLNKIPSHEIEEYIFDMAVDDFDKRKRRHGYPESTYYKEFSCEHSGKEKIIVDRLLSVESLKSPFVYWKITTPPKNMFLILIFLFLAVISVSLWLISTVTGNLLGVYYGLLFASLSTFIVRFLRKTKKKDAIEYYGKNRTAGFRDCTHLEKILSKHNINYSI